MKGLALWTFITLIVLGVSLFYLIPILFGSVEEAARRAAVVQGERIAGRINILQSSPPTTFSYIFLPKAGCNIRITEMDVTFTVKNGKEDSYVTEFISSNVRVKPAVVECSKNFVKQVFLIRCSDGIVASDKRECP